MLALHASGAAFVGLLFFSLVLLYAALVLLGDEDRPEDRWLP
jgi:hypothetical protein